MDWLKEQAFFQNIAAFVESVMGISPGTFENLSYTLFVVVGYLILRRVVLRAALRRVFEPARRYRISKTLSYAFGVITILIIAKIWLLGTVNMTTYLGFLSAGLAVALKDPITNLAGWMFLIVRQPFKVGDRVEIGAHIGDVVDIRMYMFTMLEVGNWVHADQSTGRMVHIPNSKVFTDPCFNYTHGFEYIWNEIPVIVTFESDWEKAHRILTEIAEDEAKQVSRAAASQVNRVADEYKVSYRHLTPIVWVAVVDFGVELTMRYLCKARARRATADRIWRRTLLAFAKEDTIDFAYPTRRVYNNTVEGKPGAGGPPALMQVSAEQENA